MNAEDQKYNDLIKDLRGLKKISTPPNFESDLLREINSEKFETKKESFWKKLFLPKFLIPSTAGAAAVTILLVFMTVGKKDQIKEQLVSPYLKTLVIYYPVNNHTKEEIIYSPQAGVSEIPTATKTNYDATTNDETEATQFRTNEINGSENKIMGSEGKVDQVEQGVSRSTQSMKKSDTLQKRADSVKIKFD